MRVRAILVSILFGVGEIAAAQYALPPAANGLQTTAKVNLRLSHSVDLVGAAKCDSLANIYARLANSAENNPDEYLLAPIKQIAPAGNITETFELADAFSELGAGRGIFVAQDGLVYQATIASGGVYVVAFAKDGSVKSKTKLKTGTYVDPWHLLVFGSGRFLVSGNAGMNSQIPFTAVFQADGTLLKKIYEPEDEVARNKAEAGNAQYSHDNGRGNNFVDRGDVTLGSDGNAYLLRGASPALVYAISESGEVIRKITIGVVDPRLGFRTIASNVGELAIGLSRFGHTEIRTTSLEGDPLRTYTVDGNEADVLTLACYNSQGFTLIATGSGSGAYLLKATP